MSIGNNCGKKAESRYIAVVSPDDTRIIPKPKTYCQRLQASFRRVGNESGTEQSKRIPGVASANDLPIVNSAGLGREVGSDTVKFTGICFVGTSIAFLFYLFEGGFCRAV